MIHSKLSIAIAHSLKRFLNKGYRDGYLQTHVRGSIAYQVQGLRAKTGKTQVEFAELTGKKQSTISRLENTEYGRVSVQTLLDIACANNVALLVRFVDYPQFLRDTSDMSQKALRPDDIFQSINAASLQDSRIVQIFDTHGKQGGSQSGQVISSSRQEYRDLIRAEQPPVRPLETRHPFIQMSNQAVLN